jgi:drug/metabolite transporter (DMT)-like permease
MMGAEAILGGERLTRRGLAGLLVGFFGIVLLVWPDLRAGGERAVYFGAGLVALQLACAGWAAGSSWSKRHAIEGSTLGSTALQMLFGGILMLAIGSLAGEWRTLAFNPRTFGALMYLTLAGSLGGFVAYIYALRHLPISTVSLYAYVNPVIAVVLGALLLGEPFGPRVIVSAALVLLGLAVVRSGVTGESSRAPSPAAHPTDEGARRTLGACGPQPRQARS